MGILEIDATSDEVFTATMKFNTAKPFVVAGGNSYNTTLRVERGNGDIMARVDGFVIKNAQAYCTFKPEGESKASIRFPVDKNPAVGNLFNAVWLACKAECEVHSFPVPQSPVSKDSPKPEADGGGFYPDAAFCRGNVDPKIDFAGIIMYYREEENQPYRLLLSNEDIENGTIKSYANKANKDSTICKLMKDVYNVDVKVIKNKVEINMPPKLKSNKKLVETSSFAETVKPLVLNMVDIKCKNYYVNSSNKGFYTMMSSRFKANIGSTSAKEADDIFNAEEVIVEEEIDLDNI